MTNNDLPSEMLAWASWADPYMTEIGVANPGSKNDSLDGDVMVSYFKPLDASFTNPGHEDDIYFMIVNGLSDATGTAAETLQFITLDFDFVDSGINTGDDCHRQVVFGTISSSARNKSP